MARIRSIKPEFFVSAQVADCSTTARLLFVGLWIFADDAGRHPANCKQLQMEVFPGDAFTNAEIRSWIDELITQGLVIEYEAEHEAQMQVYWQVTGWHHQKIEKPRVRYPSPESGNIRQPFGNHSATPRQPFGDHSTTRSPTTGPESTGRETIRKDLYTSLSSDGVCEKPPPREGGAKAENLVETWNAAAEKIPQLAAVRKLTQERRRKIRSRIKHDPGFTGTFADAIRRLPIPNTESFTWQPDFDWMIANDTNAVKLAEGKYDTAGNGQAKSPAEVIREIRRKRGEA